MGPVRRFVAEYSKETEDLFVEYDLDEFELQRFQIVFGIINPDDPMLDCYPVTTENIEFIETYISNRLAWDFENMSYFVEAEAL